MFIKYELVYERLLKGLYHFIQLEMITPSHNTINTYISSSYVRVNGFMSVGFNFIRRMFRISWHTIRKKSIFGDSVYRSLWNNGVVTMCPSVYDEITLKSLVNVSVSSDNGHQVQSDLNWYEIVSCVFLTPHEEWTRKEGKVCLWRTLWLFRLVRVIQ